MACTGTTLPFFTYFWKLPKLIHTHAGKSQLQKSSYWVFIRLSTLEHQHNTGDNSYASTVMPNMLTGLITSAYFITLRVVLTQTLKSISSGSLPCTSAGLLPVHCDVIFSRILSRNQLNILSHHPARPHHRHKMTSDCCIRNCAMAFPLMDIVWRLTNNPVAFWFYTLIPTSLSFVWLWNLVSC
jgi:hypothetical protein